MYEFLFQWNLVRLDVNIFKTTGKNLTLKNDYAEKFSETDRIEIQILHWVGKKQLSMGLVYVGYFTNTRNLSSKGKI